MSRKKDLLNFRTKHSGGSIKVIILTLVFLANIEFLLATGRHVKAFGTIELNRVQEKIKSLLPDLKQTVVSIETIDGAGSGVIASADGIVLSAAHVIGESGKKMDISLFDGRKLEAISKGGSQLSDAGMLQIIGVNNLPFAQISKPNDISHSGWCFALGHPSGFDPERGMVLRVGRVLRADEETIQTNCKLLGSDSGGPLFDLNGKVIGIHSRISQSPDQNYHTSIKSFLSNWDYFLKENILSLESLKGSGYLGLACTSKEDGLEVLDVFPGSAAATAGILPGDQLLRMDSIQLDSREKLTILISQRLPGDVVTIDFKRQDREVAVRLLLGSRE